MDLYVSIDELKAHLNIAVEYEAEDKMLLMLLEASQMSAEKHIRQPLTTFVDESGTLNPMLKLGILILAGNFYANRESIAYARPYIIPYTLEYLFQPFKKYT